VRALLSHGTSVRDPRRGPTTTHHEYLLPSSPFQRFTFPTSLQTIYSTTDYSYHSSFLHTLMDDHTLVLPSHFTFGQSPFIPVFSSPANRRPRTLRYELSSVISSTSMRYASDFLGTFASRSSSGDVLKLEELEHPQKPHSMCCRGTRSSVRCGERHTSS
jgi:hypothetical protein